MSTDTDNKVVQLRIAGRSPRAISKALGLTPGRINRALDKFCDAQLTEQTRKHTLSLELARLDALQAVFMRQALAGDVQSGMLVEKIIARRSLLLGLAAPPTSVLQVIDVQPKALTGVDKIEAVLNALVEDGRKNGSADLEERGRAIDGEVEGSPSDNGGLTTH
jgi:hypothetical protein